MSDLKPCHDCGAMPGGPHADGCDTARCLMTGYQRLSCSLRHNHGQDIWTGRWPGEADCIRLGWYARFVPNGNPSWQRCGKDDDGATPDLNRLNDFNARWDRKLCRWEPLAEAGD